MDAGNGAESGDGKSRIALAVQYDGTCFNGWQVQNSGRTVQGELERGLRVLLKHGYRAVASGRTDAGVHSIGQIVHFDCAGRSVTLQRLCIGLNGILERDVSVLNAYRVGPDFHARYGAVSREYLYLVHNNPQRSPFTRFRAMWVAQSLDIDYLREAAAFLVGEHDFASFCKKKSSEVNTVRRIEEINISKNEDMLVFRFRANAFLHNMIRIIVGTLIEMHKAGRQPGYIRELLALENRTFSGITAPPYGLYLHRVHYSPPLTGYESAF